MITRQGSSSGAWAGNQDRERREEKREEKERDNRKVEEAERSIMVYGTVQQKEKDGPE